MTKDNSQASESTWTTDNKTWWSRRSNMEKKLWVALGSTAILVLGFLIFVGIKPKVVSIATDVCHTPGCLQAASQIITHIDPDVDPCDDFFKFACGKFVKHIHGDIKATAVHEIENQVDRQYAEILREPISDDDHYMVQIQKELFQACMNESAVEEESMDMFKEDLKKLKGWPVVTGFKWKERYFDWIEMVARLRRWGYSYQMMLRVHVIKDPGDNDKFITYIHNPYISKIKDEHKELYKKYMTDVAVAFGATERDRAAIEMEKVLDFRERLRKVSEKNELQSENDTEANYTASLLQRRFKIEDFQDYNDVFDWVDFINMIMYPVANVSSSDYVIFPEKEFLEEFFTLIYKTPRRTQANYIIWTVVESLEYFFTKKLKQIKANYTCLTQDTSGPKKRFNYCKTVLRTNIFPVPADIIYARRYLPPEKREKVQELLATVKTEFGMLLSENSWMDDESKEKALEKLDNLGEVVGAPGDYFDDEIFEKYAMHNYTHDGSFFSMVLEISRHKYDFIYSYLHKVSNISDEETFHGVTTAVNAMYSPEENSMILPAGILQGVFYNPDRPLYLNYGAIGSIIGHELTHGFCKSASKYDKDGKENSVWTEQTEKAYEEVIQCMIENAEEFDVEDTEQKINGTLTLEENIADFTGIRVSYAAYKKWVEENGEEPQLPGIDYNPYQLFWISAISYECYKLSGEMLEKGLERDTHALNVFRATAPMRNNENFAVDFDCPADSQMNPSEKCQVF